MPRKRTSKPVADHLAESRAPDGPVDSKDVFDEVIDLARQNAEPPAPGGPAPDGRRRPRLRHTLTESVGGDAKVHVFDHGHTIGIEIELADKGDAPSAAVREILKRDGGHGRRGLTYAPRGGAKPWAKAVSGSPVGDRLDNEARFADVVDQLRKDKGLER